MIPECRFGLRGSRHGLRPGRPMGVLFLIESEMGQASKQVPPLHKRASAGP
jgi:hypothetical protein